MKSRDERLTRYVDARGTDGERRALETESDRDAELFRELALAVSLTNGLRSLPELEPPGDLVGAAEKSFNARTEVQQRRWWWYALPVTAVAALALFHLWGIARPPAPKERLPLRLMAARVQGEVLTDAQGLRRPVSVGDVVAAGQQFETGAGASLTLVIEGRTRVRLEENSGLSVVDPDERHPAVMVQAGVAQATVEVPGLPPLEVRLRGSLGRVEIRSGSVGVLHDGASSATVACAACEAIVHSAARRVPLRPGHELHLTAESVGEPRATRPLLALEVEPLGRPTRDLTLTVSGRTNPGAELRMNGKLVAVDGEGRFRHTLQLTSAPLVALVARDALRSKRMELVAKRPGSPGSVPAGPGAEPEPPLETNWEWETPG